MKKLLLSVVAFASFSGIAGTQTWDFTDDIQNGNDSTLSSNTYGNTISMVIDGIDLTVSGWADSLGVTNTNDIHSEVVEEARLVYYGESLGMINQDEGAIGDTGQPNHSIDNYDSCNWGDDIEMVLLHFSEAVSLEGINIGWAREEYSNGSTYAQSDITTVAYTGDYDGYDTDVIAGKSWSQVAADSAWTFVDDLMDVAQYDYHTVDNSNNIVSNYWLVGAYNPIFGGMNWTSDNDGFKLSGVTTKKSVTNIEPPTEVPEPAPLALFVIGAALVMTRKKFV